DASRGGADPNGRSERGDTALHWAVVGEHVDAAACLLAYGADAGAGNADGRAALGRDVCRVDILHAIRQRYHRRLWAPKVAVSAPQEAHGWAADLEQHGIVRVPGLVGPGVLAAMREEFEEFTGALDAA